jgi:hypothetical protein
METKECKQCGKTFSRPLNRSAKQFARQSYCGHECWTASRVSQVEKACLCCGKAYSVIRSLASLSKFCSWECRSRGVDQACKFCGKMYRIKPSAAPKRMTCSRSCLMKLRAAEGRHPQQGLARRPETRVRVSEGLARYYNGDPTKHPNYQGGPGAPRGPRWNRQRQLARQRDDNTCQACGKTKAVAGKNMAVHHITPFRRFASADEANRLDNLICLCQPCHMRIERGTLCFIR